MAAAALRSKTTPSGGQPASIPPISSGVSVTFGSPRFPYRYLRRLVPGIGRMWSPRNNWICLPIGPAPIGWPLTNCGRRSRPLPT